MKTPYYYYDEDDYSERLNELIRQATVEFIIGLAVVVIVIFVASYLLFF